jgi:hypothetical protein
LNDDVADHLAIRRPTARFNEITAKIRRERVVIIDAEEAKRTDHHVQVELVDVAKKESFGPAAR